MVGWGLSIPNVTIRWRKLVIVYCRIISDIVNSTRVFYTTVPSIRWRLVVPRERSEPSRLKRGCTNAVKAFTTRKHSQAVGSTCVPMPDALDTPSCDFDLWQFDLRVSACWGTAIEMCTKFGVDSSSRFTFRAPTNKQTRLNAIPSGVGNEWRDVMRYS